MKKITYTILTLCIGVIIGMTTTVAADPIKQYVQASFDKITFIVNGETKTLDADPLVYQGSTYLPVRTVLNALGYDVGYKADSKTVTAEKTAESLVAETEALIQKEVKQVNSTINASDSTEEQIKILTDQLAREKERLARDEEMVTRIKENPKTTEEDKEWAINLRSPGIEATKKRILELETKLAELK